ncbi:MAG TPA: bifunctional serine/threonine-protein kinase/formylglycine-generating enzyme family protein [Pyrinomonadaceae bacterium]|nr:bifunctional serine/threonine-protein kinase/formylglycine-generating enzyme family protein [Pyrinomonadaceae bacterium]
MLTPNTILQNRYRIVRELGHGGMGTVYEVIDQRVNCLVALKQTDTTRDTHAGSAFEREAALLANLRHPALPKVMDYFTEDDSHFLVMEFIPGHDLAELLELRGSGFPETQVLRWAEELLSVLAYLHDQRPPILHRDIKPANLKLTRKGEIFLLDFGLAKGSVGQMATAGNSQSVRGYTPIYASLEQIHGVGTDARSDIYSAAATLYHLLTGTAPVDAPARYHALEEGQADPLKPVRDLNPAVSVHIASVVQNGLALNRKHRPASAEAMWALLSATDFAQPESVETARDAPPSASDAAESSEQLVAALLHSSSAARVASGAISAGDDLPATLAPPDAGARKPAATTVRDRSLDEMTTGRDGGDTSPLHTRTRKRLFGIVAASAAVLIVIGLVFWLTKNRGVQTSDSITASQVAGNQSTNSISGRTGMPAPEGMVYVPSGAFTMGRDAGDDAERPPHPVTVNPFYIDVNEVTNEEYLKFVKATGHKAPSIWKNGSFAAGDARKPVMGVSWADASEYARWAGKRLPTEEEWEFAARGTKGFLYPWGNDWKDGAANAHGAQQTVVEVGSYKGASQFGTNDMVGNAWEWTATDFKAYPGRGLPGVAPASDLKVIRGGCYISTKDYATTTYRAGWPARKAPTYDQTGFRLAKDLTSTNED